MYQPRRCLCSSDQLSDPSQVLSFRLTYKEHGRKKHLKFIPLEEEKYGEEFVYRFFYDTIL